MVLDVLVVEDCKVVRAYLAAALEEAPDVRVRFAEDGLTAVQVAVAEPADIILMDLQLPVLDGLEAIRRIMARRPTPVVVFSGRLDRRDVDLTFEAFQAGAVEVLRKPEGLGLPLTHKVTQTN